MVFHPLMCIALSGNYWTFPETQTAVRERPVLQPGHKHLARGCLLCGLFRTYHEGKPRCIAEAAG